MTHSEIRTRIRALVLPFFTLLVLCTAVVSCGGAAKNRNTSPGGEPVSLTYARNIEIARHPGYTEVVVSNPWDTVRNLDRYLLVPRDSAMPEGLPQGTVIRIPLKKALVYSAVHSGLISRLGAGEAISGVCDSQYVTDSLLKERIAAGKITDCGMSMSPDIEKIISLHPDAILLSPFENNDRYAKIKSLGIPIVECADYMEDKSLGRAEWMKFYGLLFGREPQADEMFASIEKNYNSIKELASKTGTRPKVLIDQQYGQTWNVPGGESTTAEIIRDAGGVNPFDSFKKSGGVPLAPEKVLAMAHDADIWFVRYFQNTDKTLSELGKDAPVNSRFKAWSEGNVWGCNTSKVPFFDETPFHPDWQLADMVRILHPELAEELAGTPVYYSKLRK